MRRILIGLFGLAVLAAAVPAAARLTERIAVSEAPVQRIVKTFPDGPSISCHGDACGIGLAEPVPVLTPEDSTAANVSVTLTVEYHTSPGDGARISLRSAQARTSELRPGAFLLAPSVRPTTTTLVWSEAELPTGGQAYSFRPLLQGVNKGPAGIEVHVTKMTMVIELWEV
jgi:hypothetical protein